ncbi:GNAT family N-acetyltransferase [Shimia sp. SDUM112013]|uniref:GNAT family N-acetyltransferase n=1 Tax=Shimia sp. SDUM112013 TaxID=3136160 RepID=UPI0032ED50FF
MTDREYQTFGDQPAVRIEWAGLRDAEHLRPLLLALYRHDTPDAPEPSQEQADEHVALLLNSATPHRLAIAWDCDGLAIGLAAVAILTSVSDPRRERWRQIELKELFVLPSHQNKGVGESLFNWIEKEAHAAGACRLDWHVRSDNALGIAFYLRLGGTMVENRSSMRKSLIGF